MEKDIKTDSICNFCEDRTFCTSTPITQVNLPKEYSENFSITVSCEFFTFENRVSFLSKTNLKNPEVEYLTYDEYVVKTGDTHIYYNNRIFANLEEMLSYYEYANTIPIHGVNWGKVPTANENIEIIIAKGVI